MKILCLKQVAFEGPASIADWADRRGHTIATVDVYLAEPLPPVDSFDCLLVMGGPMNIHEHDAYPWLVSEKALIREAIDSGKIVVGVCLGGQLIADALRAPVSRGKNVEIGWFDIERSIDCPAGLPMPEALRVYHWHGDTFAIPEGAIRIAGSAACTNQGFIYDGRVLAWQCHLETTPESLRALATACADEITQGPFIMSAETMLAEPESTYTRMQDTLFAMLDQLG